MSKLALSTRGLRRHPLAPRFKFVKIPGNLRSFRDSGLSPGYQATLRPADYCPRTMPADYARRL